MPHDDASVPQPTNGIAANSSRPWSVPSSPYVPCRTGNTTSRRPTFDLLSSSISSLRDGSPTIATSSVELPSCCFDNSRWALAGNNSAAAAGASQFPSFVIAMGMTSYFDLSIASMTERAERIETSCSPERPPKITPMRSFFDICTSPQRTQRRITRSSYLTPIESVQLPTRTCDYFHRGPY